jgi:hypothetical protein
MIPFDSEMPVLCQEKTEKTSQMISLDKHDYKVISKGIEVWRETFETHNAFPGRGYKP